ncbi:MAG: hypothetical protein CV088_06185 [Nitrospira sp. LK70]|nr:hypothetical protein [Nitrospira sp. LK70]
MRLLYTDVDRLRERLFFKNVAGDKTDDSYIGPMAVGTGGRLVFPYDDPRSSFFVIASVKRKGRLYERAMRYMQPETSVPHCFPYVTFNSSSRF